jgi:DNA-binding response OmpR family regulator
MKKVIVIEDQTILRDLICQLVDSYAAMEVIAQAGDGAEGYKLCLEHKPDLVILDLMLPRRDGLSVCKSLREECHSDTPVLMLTARDTLEDKISGFNSGADDYLVKPFEIEELEARIRALVRRQFSKQPSEVLTVGDLTYDLNKLMVVRNGQQLQLSPISLKLLKILMEASPNVVTRREIEQLIWGDVLPDSDTLRSHMYNLRKSIDRPFSESLLHTLPSNGYRLHAKDENT